MKIKLKFNFKIFIIQLITLYLIIGILLFTTQNSIIYKTTDQNFYNCQDLDYTQKVNYNGTRFYYENNSENLIVFYHGNAGSACDRAYLANLFDYDNLSFIFVEFAGYSNNTKKPNKESLFQDVKNVNNFINDVSYDNLIIGSESIGGALASYHVSISNPNKVFLISPFDKMENVASSKFPFSMYPAKILLKDKYNNYDKFSNFNGELLIIHGNKDMIIPNELSYNLYESINITNKEYALVEEKGHNDILSFQVYKKLGEFILK